MPLDVQATTFITRDAASVSAYAFEPTNDPIWIGGITKAELITPRPVGKGTQVQRLAGFMGRTIDYVLEVVEFEPGHRMHMRSIKGPFPMQVTYTFEPANGGTKATLRVQGEPKAFYGRVFDWFMAPMVRKNLRRDLRNLRRIMEQGS